jgi:cobalt-zinc-cadmium efflux system outer membrane protein
MPMFTKAEGQLAIGGAIPTADQVFALVEQSPEVTRWTTEMLRRQAVARLERRKAISDLTLGGGVRRETEKTDDGTTVARGFTVGASIAIPIFDRNQGGIRESQYSVAKGHAEQRAARARVLTEIADAYQSMAAAHARSAILGQEVVPEAQKAFDAATAGYNEGKFPYLDVLDAQRTVFDARVQHLEARAEHLAAVADIEGLVGQTVESITEAKVNTQEAATQKSQEE